MHSKSQQELAMGALAGNAEDLKNLEYFTAQLQLFCNMCYNRQYLAILKIKEQLPIEVVLRYSTCSYTYCTCTHMFGLNL